jgi:3-isopropylmalate/(R)-2-methylmalate dehydratase small subunit
MAMSKVVLKLGADISTDIIYPGRFMATVLPAETPQFCFADMAEFNSKLKAGEIAPGSVIVADKNFGCGSSREQAASCIKGFDLKVIAKDFARIFMQNALNLGLDMVICPGIEASEGDEVMVEGMKVINATTGRAFDAVPLPKARQAIIDAGGLIPYTRKILQDSRGN